MIEAFSAIKIDAFLSRIISPRISKPFRRGYSIGSRRFMFLDFSRSWFSGESRGYLQCGIVNTGFWVTHTSLLQGDIVLANVVFLKLVFNHQNSHNGVFWGKD